MIIVSQDKEAIVNFENVEVLGVGNPLENEHGLFAIIANAMTDNQYILGEYTTKERAKKVLKEIINTYSNFETAKYVEYSRKEFTFALISGNYDYFDTYQMPKE